jgi:cell wall-associated NlpC family hydrolase
MRLSLVAVIAALSTSLVVGCAVNADTPSDGVGGANGGSTGETMGAPLDPNAADEEGQGDVGDDDGAGDLALVGVDESGGGVAASDEVMATVTQARTTANLNLRKSASTSASILAVIPKSTVVTLVSSTQSNGFYNVKYNGITGWSYASYLTPVATEPTTPPPTSVDINGPASPANTIARAKAAVGFSYWWGGGAWLEDGPTSSTKGSCSGSCPSCSHSGKYGADCSGLVAKAWQFGTKTLSVNSHPYSTVSFNADASGKWSTVSRGSLRAGDALVYNSGGAGHIVIYEKGDGWGSPTVYECRGCSYGCVHNARSFTSKYHGIRRAGF